MPGRSSAQVFKALMKETSDVTGSPRVFAECVRFFPSRQPSWLAVWLVLAVAVKRTGVNPQTVWGR